jgi:hypothetical protein
MYGRGQLSLDPSGVTLSRFWQVAAGALRTHALSFIGRSLANSDDEVPAEIIERFATLWEFRLSFIAQNMTTDYDPSELSAFGSWFISDKFDITWSLQQLYHALQMVGETDPDHSVVEKLAKIAPQFPRESIQCLELLIKGDKNGWKVDLWRESARVVISAALQSSDAHTKTLAGNLVNFLMSRGRYDFRDILQDKT